MKKVIKAPAKINLCLKVNGVRDDGYHDLSMIMQTISLFDILEFEIINENNPQYNSCEQISLKCNCSFIPLDEKNLIYKITKYIIDRFNIKDKIFINLIKIIPTCGGLGGGSSDAASTLIFLNEYFKLKLNTDELTYIASIFGSDIPFFIYKHECLCEGRGEIITKLNIYKNYYVLIATPNIKVSTKEIFKKIDYIGEDSILSHRNSRSIDNCIGAINNRNLKSLSNNIFNDLELVTENIYKDISKFKRRMLDLGAFSSLMSGSGPSVFGVFSSYLKALNCKRILKKEYKDAFVYIAKPI